MLKVTVFKQRCAQMCQLSTVMKRKNLSLDKKMKVIDCANKNPEIKNGMSGDCSIGKNCFRNILWNAKNLWSKFVFSKGNCKKLRHKQNHLINETLVPCYKKYASANVFPDGQILNKSNGNKRQIKQRWIDYVHSIKWVVSKVYNNIEK